MAAKLTLETESEADQEGDEDAKREVELARERRGQPRPGLPPGLS
jgi:hypothetical protein